MPRLREMGVDMLWFMPIQPISHKIRQGTLGSYYACSNYIAVNPEFGDLDDFIAIVEQAHALGQKVIIDWVANHTGWDHVWTELYPGFYMKDAAGNFYDKNGWHDVIDLNYYDASMRKTMIESMQFWVEACDIDGFRCDMAHLVPLDFWRQARTALDRVKPLFWLAETEDRNYLDVFDCCYAWEWMHVTEKYMRGERNLMQLREVLDNYIFRFPGDTFQMFFTSNHDENSWNGTEYEKYGDAAKMLAVLSCLWKGLPLIYSGQEQPNLRRLKFFDKDCIEWTGEPQLQAFYRELLHLKGQHPALVANAETTPVWLTTNNEDHILCFRRKLGDEEVIVVLNFAGHAHEVHIQSDTCTGAYRELFTKAELTFGGQNLFPVEQWGYRVFVKQP
jgi:glycosidase